jgi:hypothetical protein
MIVTPEPRRARARRAGEISNDRRSSRAPWKDEGPKEREGASRKARPGIFGIDDAQTRRHRADLNSENYQLSTLKPTRPFERKP